MLKKKLNKFFLVLWILHPTLTAFSQDTYNLQMLINRVLAENYEVLIQKNQEVITQNNNTPGNAGLLPVIDAEGTAYLSFNNTKQEYSSGQISEGNNAQTDFMNAMIAVNWTIFDGFKMFARKQQLDLIEQLGVVNTRYFIEQTIADITIAYYQLVQEKELQLNYKNALDISRFRYILEKKKISVGSGNALLYNQALVDYNNDSLSVLEIENLIKTLEIQICRYANIEIDQQLSIATDSIVPGLIDSKENLIKKAINSNEEIKQAMLEEMIAEKNVEIQKSDYYPIVNLFGQYSYTRQSNEVGFMRQNNTFGPQLGVAIRFNLYNGGNDRREVINQEIIQENTAFNTANKTNIIYAAVLEKYYQYVSFNQQLLLARNNVLAANRTLEIAKLQFENGTINGYDFRQTQLDLLQANNKLIIIEFRMKNLEVQLNRLTGNLMSAYLD